MSSNINSISTNAYAQGGGLVEFNPRNPAAPILIASVASLVARSGLASRVSVKPMGPGQMMLEAQMARIANLGGGLSPQDLRMRAMRSIDSMP